MDCKKMVMYAHCFKWCPSQSLPRSTISPIINAPFTIENQIASQATVFLGGETIEFWGGFSRDGEEKKGKKKEKRKEKTKQKLSRKKKKPAKGSLGKFLTSKQRQVRFCHLRPGRVQQPRR